MWQCYRTIYLCSNSRCSNEHKVLCTLICNILYTTKTKYLRYVPILVNKQNTSTIENLLAQWPFRGTKKADYMTRYLDTDNRFSKSWQTSLAFSNFHLPPTLKSLSGTRICKRHLPLLTLSYISHNCSCIYQLMIKLLLHVYKKVWCCCSSSCNFYFF